MRPIKEQQQEQARNLYFQSEATRAEIAQQIGVSEKTIYLWTKQGDWRRLRSASRTMPSLIVENFYAQVQELNDDIRMREPGKRYPSVQEAETFRKLIITAERIKKKATQSEYMEMMQKFMEWMMPQNNEHLKLFTDYSNSFLKQQSVDGFQPFDIEYKNEEFPSLKGDSSNSTTVEIEQGDVESEQALPLLRGDVPQTTTVVSEQGCVQSTKEPQPDQEPHQNTVTPSPLVEKGSGDEVITHPEQVTIGNNFQELYEAPTNTSPEIEEQKKEITHEQEIIKETPLVPERGGPLLLRDGEGTLAQDNHDIVNTSTPSERSGEVLIGYIGTNETILPNGTRMTEIKLKTDPGIQKFSIGEAIYYIKKRE